MPTPAPRLQAFRAGILHFVDDPAQAGDAAGVAHEDGLLVLADGKVRAFGEAAELLPACRPRSNSPTTAAGC